MWKRGGSIINEHVLFVGQWLTWLSVWQLDFTLRARLKLGKECRYFMREICISDWSIFFFNLEIQWWIKWKSIKIMNYLHFYDEKTWKKHEIIKFYWWFFSTFFTLFYWENRDLFRILLKRWWNYWKMMIIPV